MMIKHIAAATGQRRATAYLYNQVAQMLSLKFITQIYNRQNIIGFSNFSKNSLSYFYHVKNKQNNKLLLTPIQ